MRCLRKLKSHLSFVNKIFIFGHVFKSTWMIVCFRMSSESNTDSLLRNASLLNIYFTNICYYEWDDVCHIWSLIWLPLQEHLTSLLLFLYCSVFGFSVMFLWTVVCRSIIMYWALAILIWIQFSLNIRLSFSYILLWYSPLVIYIFTFYTSTFQALGQTGRSVTVLSRKKTVN